MKKSKTEALKEAGRYFFHLVTRCMYSSRSPIYLEAPLFLGKHTFVMLVIPTDNLTLKMVHDLCMEVGTRTHDPVVEHDRLILPIVLQTDTAADFRTKAKETLAWAEERFKHQAILRQHHRGLHDLRREFGIVSA